MSWPRAYLLLQKGKSNESRMPFVHVKQPDAITEGAEHGHTTKPKNCFLAETIMVIAAVKMICQSAIARIVFLQVCIEKQQWHRVTGDAVKQILPDAHTHFSVFYRDGNLRR